MESVFLHILDVGVTAGFAVVGVLLIRFLCKKAPKWITVLLWGIVGLRLIMPFSVESAISLMPSFHINEMVGITQQVPAQSAPAESPDELHRYEIPPEIFMGEAPLTQPTAPQVTTPATDAAGSAVTRTRVGTVVWLFGVTAMVWYAVLSYIGVYRRVRTATKSGDNVYACEAVSSPFVFGLIRPRIYVPYGLDETQLSAVTAHERAHIKRLDHIIKPLAFLLLSVYWFQPLLWIAYWLLCRDIELACDEYVVKSLDDEARRGYSKALVASAVGRARIAACPLAFGEVAVKERVKKVMSYKKPALWIVIAALIIGAATSAVLLTDTPEYKTLENASFEGAELKFYRGYWCWQTLYLSKEREELTASTTLGDLGAFGFAVKEIDTEDMTVTVSCNREMWLDGEAVTVFDVPHNKEVILRPEKDDENHNIRVCIELPSAKDDLEWVFDDDSKSMVLRRYVSGTTALYLYNGYFSLVEDDMGITSVTEPMGRCLISSEWYQFPLSYKTYFPTASVTEGHYEWVDDTLVLTEDGGLTQYVLRVSDDQATLKNLKGKMSRHAASNAPMLSNNMTFRCEYMLTAVKTSDERAPIEYTLSDGKGTYSFRGSSDATELMITSLSDGQVYLTREAPSHNEWYEECEWIDLSAGESRGVRSRMMSDHNALGSVGYVPSVMEANGKVIVKVLYVSWCGTGIPEPRVYKLEGLTSLKNGTVTAIVDDRDLLISYIDDQGRSHVIAEELTDEATPMEQPLVTATAYLADGHAIDNEAEQAPSLYYHRIMLASIRLDGEYVDVAWAMANGKLDYEAVRQFAEQATADGFARIRRQSDDETVYEFLNVDMYHTIRLVHTADTHEVHIGEIF